MTDRLLNAGRCPVCDWPLAASREQGCVADDCSYRPKEGSPEYYRIQRRRQCLALLAARTAESNALMDEIERDLSAS